VQFQPEPGEPAAQLVPEPLGVLPVPGPDDEVVRLCRGPGYADLVLDALVRAVSGLLVSA
jgi:5-formyltetrahydrofolate cyclo-ligase